MAVIAAIGISTHLVSVIRRFSFSLFFTGIIGTSVSPLGTLPCILLRSNDECFETTAGIVVRSLDAAFIFRDRVFCPNSAVFTIPPELFWAAEETGVFE